MNKTLATALMVLAMLSSLIFSTAPAFADSKGKGEGNTPVSYCHNGRLITTDDDGELNGHKTGKGVHVNDVFMEDLGRPVTQADCKPPVEETPGPAVTVTPSPVATTPAKGTPPATTVPVPPHAEPNPGTPHTVPNDLTAQPYPAPSVTPNTVNGTPPASANPTPAPTVPVTPAATATDRLADTGANDSLYIWGAVGLLALIAGIWSVIHARRKA